MIKIKKIVLIPAYEPETIFIELLKELYENEFQIIVIDDGSGKNYEKIFEKAKKYAKIISYEINKGKGEAIKTGLKYIKDNYHSRYIIVTMDCDGQHTVKDAQKLFEKAFQNENSLIIGKRIRNKNTPLKSKLGNVITRYMYRKITGNDVYDTQSGLRAFSNKLINFLLNVEGTRYEYEMNVLLQCSLENINVEEVKIESIYINNNSKSHFQVLKDSIRNI